MAILLTSEPADFTPVNRVQYRLVMSDGGTDPEIKRFGYRFLVNGSPVTDKRSAAFDGKEYILDFGEVCGRFHNLSFPEGSQLLGDAFVEASLEYFEIVYNKETGEVTEQGSATSTAVKVIPYFEKYMGEVDESGKGVICTLKPTRLQIDPDQPDWISLFGFTGLNYQMVWFDRLGTELASHSGFVGAGQYANVPIDLISPPVEIEGIPHRMEFRLTSSDDGDPPTISTDRTFFIEYLGCGDRSVMFLDSYGGWNGVTFDDISFGASRESSQFSRTSLPGDSTDIQTGTFINTSRGFKTITLSKRFKRRLNDDMIVYLAELRNAKVHYIKGEFEFGKGQKYYQFILDSGKTDLMRGKSISSFSISGRLVLDEQTLAQNG